jgi:proline iminopeptidase
MPIGVSLFMGVMRFLGRAAVVLVLAGTAYAVTLVLVFLHGSSSWMLAWIPALAAVVAVVVGLLLDWRRKTVGRKAVDGVLAALLVAGAAAAAAGLRGWFTAAPRQTSMAAMASEGYVATRDGAIYFHQTALPGSERPVLLVLHGGPGSGSVPLRAALGDLLGASFRTVFFDQRGVGRSSAVASFRLDDYLDDIEHLRRALQVDSWSLFGISWGAALANEYTVRYPDRVRGVVTWGGLVANEAVTRSMLGQLRAFYTANGDQDGVSWCQSLEGQSVGYTRLQSIRVMNTVNRARLKTVVPENVQIEAILAARDRAVRQWGYAPSQTGTNLWATAATFMENGLEGYDFRPRLREIGVPYLFLAGEHDPLLISAGLDEQAKSMPRAKVRRVPGAGHTIDQSEAIAAEVVGFVSAIAEGK